MLLCMERNAARRVMFPMRRKKAPLNDGRKIGTMANKRRTSTLDQQIDENLRRVYSDTANEPLPDRFTQLLDQLREQERDKSGPTSEDDS
jgi:hemerythrin-like domain-containing protein